MLYACEQQIVENAIQLAEYSIQYEEIDFDVFFTSDLIEICRKNALKIPQRDFDLFKTDLLHISNSISNELETNGLDSRSVKQIATDISTQNKLELTIPIIPLLLAYKTSISLDTKLCLKKWIVLLLKKIKGGHE